MGAPHPRPAPTERLHRSGRIDRALAELGEQVLHEAAARARGWEQRFGAAAPSIHVNLSSRQIVDTELLDTVQAVLATTGLRPSLLCLELTESVLLEDSDRAIGTVRDLKALGVRLAIDDFGTGYSSLSYLSRLPVDVVKIDRSFVEGLDPARPHSSVIAAAIVSLARALGLASIAEGVATVTQLAELHRLGCDAAQGFYFSPAAGRGGHRHLPRQPAPTVPWHGKHGGRKVAPMPTAVPPQDALPRRAARQAATEPVRRGRGWHRSDWARRPWRATCALGVANPGEGGAVLCPFRAVTGLDCPGCGMTRATRQLVRLHPGAAVDYNLLLVLGLPVVAYLYVSWLVRSTGRALPQPRVGARVGAVLVGLVVVFSVVRNLPIGPGRYLNSLRCLARRSCAEPAPRGRGRRSVQAAQARLVARTRST